MNNPFGNMSVPGASSGLDVLSPAGLGLGLGGMLRDQVKDETEEQRKKRLEQRRIGGAPTPAVMQLLGGL